MPRLQPSNYQLSDFARNHPTFTQNHPSFNMSPLSDVAEGSTDGPPWRLPTPYPPTALEASGREQTGRRRFMGVGTGISHFFKKEAKDENGPPIVPAKVATTYNPPVPVGEPFVGRVGNPDTPISRIRFDANTYKSTRVVADPGPQNFVSASSGSSYFNDGAVPATFDETPLVDRPPKARHQLPLGAKVYPPLRQGGIIVGG